MNSLKHYLKLIVFLLTDYIGILLFRPKSTSDLAILRLDAIGDFVLFCDSAKEYRELYPDSRITLIANNSWTDLAKHLPFWDDVIPIDTTKFVRNISYRLEISKYLRQVFYDLIIHPTYSRDFLVGDSLVHLLNADIKIGFDGDLSNISAKGKKISDDWYDVLIKSDKKPQMELRRNAEFVRKLGGKDFKSSIPDLLPFLASTINPLDSLKDYFVIFPFSSWCGKEWPISKFILLVEKLCKEHNLKCVICGGPNDVKLAKKITSESDVDIINYVGKTDLITLSRIIHSSRLVVANDTSAVHIAASVGVNSVCILGGGHYQRFLPYSFEKKSKNSAPSVVVNEMECFGCNWNCPFLADDYSPVPCIKNIEIEQVYKMCIRQL